MRLHKNILIVLMAVCIASCASVHYFTSITEESVMLDAVKKEELSELFSYPVCLEGKSGIVCGGDDSAEFSTLGEIFVAIYKDETGDDAEIEDIISNISTGPFSEMTIQELPAKQAIQLRQLGHTGDIFYKLAIVSTEEETVSIIVGVKDKKLYIAKGRTL